MNIKRIYVDSIDIKLFFVRIFVQIGMFVMMFDICDVYFWEERATVL